LTGLAPSSFTTSAGRGSVAKLFAEFGGGFGQGLRWEWRLLELKEGTR
jgi:hypothetical protein